MTATWCGEKETEGRIRLVAGKLAAILASLFLGSSTVY
jgi:hypothetical protein